MLYACLFLSGAHVKPGPLLGSFAGASILGLVSMVPGGLGVFEGLMLVALSSGGYDQGAVTAGLFLFRIAYYLLPLLAALYLGSGTVAKQMPILAHAMGRLRAHPLFGVLGLPASLLAESRHSPARGVDVPRRPRAARRRRRFRPCTSA